MQYRNYALREQAEGADLFKDKWANITIDGEISTAGKRTNDVLGTPLYVAVSGRQQAINRGRPSRFKGVTWSSHTRKWKAQIRGDGKQKYLG